jgi:hypothetical protein
VSFIVRGEKFVTISPCTGSSHEIALFRCQRHGEREREASSHGLISRLRGTTFCPVVDVECKLGSNVRRFALPVFSFFLKGYAINYVPVYKVFCMERNDDANRCLVLNIS